MIFDVLYVKSLKGDEINLMEHQLKDRKAVLRKIIKNKQNQLECVLGTVTSDINKVFRLFDDSVRDNQEGIIIKLAESIYQPSNRSSDWLKLKSDYLEGLSDTLDVIILGGYFGEGKTRIGSGYNIGQGWTEFITHFLLGVSIKIDERNPKESAFLPFCKVGTGYTVNELKTLR